jgi:hypothetical protein
MPIPRIPLPASSFADFGTLLRVLRRRARLTQRELGVAVGYSEAQISRLEQGKRLPDPAAVATLFVLPLALASEPALAARLHALAKAARAAPRRPATPGCAPPDSARPDAPPGSVRPVPRTPTPPTARPAAARRGAAGRHRPA